MNSYKLLGKQWSLWAFCLFIIYASLSYSLYQQKSTYKVTSNIKLAGFSFPTDAQGIRLGAYEDTYSNFSESMGGIYLFSSSLAYGRFKHEY